MNAAVSSWSSTSLTSPLVREAWADDGGTIGFVLPVTLHGSWIGEIDVCRLDALVALVAKHRQRTVSHRRRNYWQLQVWLRYDGSYSCSSFYRV